MATKLIYVIFEKSIHGDDTRHPVEWCASYNEAQRRCEELNEEDAEYKHTFIQLPGNDK